MMILVLGCNYNYRTCDIINGEMTCFCFDKDMKRLFLSDNNGRIKNFIYQMELL